MFNQGWPEVLDIKHDLVYENESFQFLFSSLLNIQLSDRISPTTTKLCVVKHCSRMYLALLVVKCPAF